MANTVVGKLQAVLTAVTQPFDAGLAKAQRTTAAFASSVGDFGAVAGNDFRQLGRAVEKALGPVASGYVEALQLGMKGLKLATVSWTSALGAAKTAINALSLAGGGILKLATSVGTLVLKAGALAGAFFAVKAATDHFERINEMLERTNRLLEASRPAWAKYEESLAEVDELFKRGEITQEQWIAVSKLLQEELAKTSGAIDMMADAVAAFQAEEQALDDAWHNEIMLLQRLAQQYIDLIETPMERYQRQLDQINQLFGPGGFLENMERYRRALELITDEYNKATGATQEWEDTQRRIAQLVEENLTPLERYQKTIKELEDLLKKGLDPETFDRAVRRAKEDLDEALKRLEPKAEKAERPSEFKEVRLSRIALNAISPEQNVMIALQKRVIELLKIGNDIRRNTPLLLRFD